MLVPDLDPSLKIMGRDPDPNNSLFGSVKSIHFKPKELEDTKSNIPSLSNEENKPSVLT